MKLSDRVTDILAAIQVDPGQRGLAKDPHNNLFNYCRDDLLAAATSLVQHPRPRVWILTGFQIPTANPPAWETDGPLGASFLLEAFADLRIEALVPSYSGEVFHDWPSVDELSRLPAPSHLLSIERVGPGRDGRCRTMRGRDITDRMTDVSHLFGDSRKWTTIGIGDGGNELGLGKIPHQIVANNIPNGELIHCQIATDFTIVAGVSNWGGYALAATMYLLQRQTPRAGLFEEANELARLQDLIVRGKLVDGVTGQPTATVDGLTWEQYMTPFRQISAMLNR